MPSSFPRRARRKKPDQNKRICTGIWRILRRLALNPARSFHKTGAEEILFRRRIAGTRQARNRGKGLPRKFHIPEERRGERRFQASGSLSYA